MYIVLCRRICCCSFSTSKYNIRPSYRRAVSVNGEVAQIHSEFVCRILNYCKFKYGLSRRVYCISRTRSADSISCIYSCTRQNYLCTWYIVILCGRPVTVECDHTHTCIITFSILTIFYSTSTI